MDKRVIVFSAVMAALMLASAAIVITHSDESDAATLNYDVGDTISNQGFGVGDTWTGSIPGISFEVRQYGGQFIVVGAGTFTTAGTYTIKTYIGSSLQDTTTVTVSSPTPTEYVVTFSSGTGGSVNVRNTTAYSGSTYSSSGNTLTISYGSQELITATATPASGYAFDHWSSSSGTITSNKTITAYFSALTPTTYTCYLYYNANGGSFAPSTQSYTGTSTSSHTFTISSQEPVRNGYTFLGWSTSSTATTATYHGGNTISVGYNSSKTLYAVWQAVSTYTVMLSSGTGGSVSPSSVSVQSGTTFSASGATLSFSDGQSATATPNTDYVFDHWSSTSGTISSSTTITAYFVSATPADCTVTLVADPSIGGTLSAQSVTVPSGTTPVLNQNTITIGSYTITATPAAGYGFANWLNAGTITSDKTISAHFTHPKSYVVGTAVDERVGLADTWTGTVPGLSFAADGQVASGAYYIRATGTPTTAGYYTLTTEYQGGTTYINFDVQNPATAQYTVSISITPSGGGTVTDNSVTVDAGTAVSTSGNTLTIGSYTITATPASGYSSVQWQGVRSTVDADFTINAYFAPIPQYTYTVEDTPAATITVNGTQISSDYTGTIQSGGSITVSAVMDPNYTFTRWQVYQPDTGIYDYITTLNFTDTISADTDYTMEATFNPPTPDPVVTFTRNSTSWGTVSQNTLTVVSGTTFTSSGNALTFTTSGTVVGTVTATPNQGYYFDHWSVSSGTITSDLSIMAYFGEALAFDFDVGESVSATLYSGDGQLTISGTSPPGTEVTTLHVYDPGSSLTPPVNFTSVLIEGTPTTVGVYEIIVSDGTHIEITINPAGTHTFYTVSFFTDPVNGGTVSTQSFRVREGTTWTKDGNEVQFQQPGSTTYLYSEATANPGFEFTGWSNAGNTGTVYQNMTFTAYFADRQIYHTVTFYSYPAGAGTIAPASMSVLHGTPYTITGDMYTGEVLTIGDTEIVATPNQGYAFFGWGVLQSGTITEDEDWSANFTSATHTVTISADPSAGGTVSQNTLAVDHHTVYEAYRDTEYSGHLTIGDVTITALANNGYVFEGWNHMGTGQVISDMTFTAFFSMERHYFSVDANPSVGGTITPSQSQMVPVGTAYTTNGNVLTLHTSPNIVITAEPTSGFRFDHWGSESGIVDRQMTVVAYFIGTTEYTVEFASYPSEGGSVSPLYLELPYYTTFTATGNVLKFTNAHGTQEVEATAAEGYSFHHWEPSNGIVNRNQTVTAVFDKDYHVTVKYNRNATITVDGTEITHDTILTVNQANRHQIECVPNADYRFAFYTYIDDEEEIQTNENPTQLPLCDTVFSAVVVREGDVTVTFVSGDHGTVSPASVSVPSGSRFTQQGNSLVLIQDPSIVVTATPASGYVLRGWSENVGRFIIDNTTITAYFEYDMGNAVWWDNGYANNKATIVLDYPSTLGNYSRYMTIPLLKYDRLATDSDPQYFRDAGYRLSIETGFNKRIFITLTENGVQKYAASYDPGVWQRYALILDTANGTLSYQGISSAARNPVDEFNFMDYTPIFTSKIADWSGVCDGLSFARIYHKDVGSGSHHPNFQIGNTATFLNTYGVVMIDPVLNIYEQFPAYEDLRLNLYSFAIYGDTITINNRTFDMDGSYIVVKYDKVNGRNVVSPTGAETFTAPLTNVYITWTNIPSTTPSERQCYLTFVERNQVFDLGTFAIGDLTISGEGMWYFTTALWEPFDTVKKTYVMDWSSPFNLDGNGFLLIFIALLVIVLVIMNIFWQPTVLDYAVVFGAGLISLITLGTF